MRSWLTQMNLARYVFDVLLLVFFLIASAPQATGIAVHEWISFLYLIPFVMHLLLHWDWIRTVPVRFFRGLTLHHRLNVFWDALLYIAMLIVTISGVLISEVALPVFGLALTPDSFWHELHHSSSNLLFPMLGIHLALHWDWIKRTTQKMRAKKVPDSVDTTRLEVR